MKNDYASTILCAGKGTRLGLTDVPKPMAGVGERPMLDYFLHDLLDSGFTGENTTIVTGHLSEVVESYYGSDFQYVRQDSLVGPLLGIRDALSVINEKVSNMLIVYGDESIFFKRQLIGRLMRYHDRHDSPLTVGLTPFYDPLTHKTAFRLNPSGTISEIGQIQYYDMYKDANSHLMPSYFCGSFVISIPFLEYFFSYVDEQKIDINEKGIGLIIKYLNFIGYKSYGYVFKNPRLYLNRPDELYKLRTKYYDFA